MGTKVNKNVFDLEYSKMEKAEMITYLNRLLSSYQVYILKTRGFQWNVIGQDHFDLRQKFNSLVKRALIHMDEIAERIRLFNQWTMYSLKEILETSEISETSTNLTGFEMVKTITSDLVTLLNIHTDSIEKAKDLGDYGTEGMLKNHVKELEQDYMLLISWLK
jgi:starvation-inducible DNA-binding protein